MWPALFTVLASSSVSLSPTGLCSVQQHFWLRQDHPHYVIVAATADSVPAALWEPKLASIEIVRSDSTPPAPRLVWGQVAQIVRVAPTLRNRFPKLPQKAAFVLWGRVGDCSPVPDRALWIAPGDTVFIVATPQRENRSFSKATPEMPRFELSRETVTYSPRATDRTQPSQRVLSVAQFETFYRALPTVSAWNRDPITATRPLWAWARAHPALAKLSPAREWISVVRHEVSRTGDSSSARRAHN